MRYLITTKNKKAFYSNYFDIDNFFNPDIEMVVFDLDLSLVTFDGKKWEKIDFDNL